MQYRLELRSSENKKPIASEYISLSADEKKREALAAKLCRRYSTPEECYVVEYQHDSSSPVGAINVVREYTL